MDALHHQDTNIRSIYSVLQPLAMLSSKCIKNTPIIVSSYPASVHKNLNSCICTQTYILTIYSLHTLWDQCSVLSLNGFT